MQINKTKTNHAQANDYRDLCNAAGDVLSGKQVNLPEGYKILATEINRKNNFKAIAYKKGDEIILCYLGTDAKNLKDHSTNLKMAVTCKPTSQMKSAMDFYEKIKKENFGANFKALGYSEGGSEALYVGLSNKIETTTFNAYGLHKNLLKKFDKDIAEELVTNYRDPDDPISKLRNLPGKTFIVDAERGVFEKINPFGMVSAHRISNFGDCNNSQPLEEYKEKHKNFISCVDDAVITGEDIEKMPRELYEIYDSEISERLSQGKILHKGQAEEQSFTGDLIKVSAYVRDDGTQVDGYYRRRPNNFAA